MRPASASSAASPSSCSVSPWSLSDIDRFLGYGHAEGPQRAVEPDRKDFARTAQHGTDLGHIEVVVETQNEQLAMVVRQLPECPPQHIPVEGGGQRVESRVDRLLAGVGFAEGDFVSVGAYVVHEGVGGDAVQPPPQRLFPEVGPANVL